MTRRVRRMSGRIIDFSGSCENCDWSADRGVRHTDRVAVGKRARAHTAGTGHQTFVRIERMIFYEAAPSLNEGPPRPPEVSDE